MPDNNQHIPLPANEWVDLYAESGITVGQPIFVENVGTCDIYLSVQAVEPDKDHGAYDVLKRDDDIRLTNNLGDTGAWAFCNTTDGLISVSENSGFYPALPTLMRDGYGNPISSLKGAIDIHDADVHSIPVNELFHRHTGNSTTLAANITAGDTSISVVDGAAFANGTHIQIENGVIETTFPTIISGGGTNTFVLDRPIDNDFTTGDPVEEVSTNIAVAGSLASPIAFRLIPDTDQVWHIVRFLFAITHKSAADDSKFGSISALQNGMILRAYNATANQHRTFTSWKSNFDIKMDMFDVTYTDKAGGGNYGTNGRGSVRLATGASPRLDGAAGDYLELLVQDDLTIGAELLSYNFKGQGHIEGL